MLSLTLHLSLVIASQYINPLPLERCNAVFGNANVTFTEELRGGQSDVNYEHNFENIFQFLQLIYYMGWLAVAKGRCINMTSETFTCFGKPKL